MAAAAICAGGVGVGAAAVIKSPGQVAAESAPPPRDILTAPVEHRVLSKSIVTRGAVTASQSVAVTPGDAADESARRSVFTKVKVRAGDEVGFGRVLLEVSGRPVFALRGDLPAYRDLGPGTSGEDVAQLQKALRASGHSTASDRAGVFGAGTGRAVSAFYRSIGYTPAPGFTPTEDGTSTREPRGPVVPAAEVVFLASAPARVETVKAKVGEAAGDAALTISAGARIVTATVAPHEKDLVRAGQKVKVLSAVTGKEVSGSVTSVSETPVEREEDKSPADRGTYAVTVQPDAELPADFAADVRVTIEAASSQGKVLAVPSSAISASTDGRTTVTVRTAAGAPRRVDVRTGMSADGFVQITPADGTRLAAGVPVVVGVESEGGHASGH